jgi:hypothetical protein
MPCSPTPVGPQRQAIAAPRCCLPPFVTTSAPTTSTLTGLNHTACPLAVYASSPPLPTATQDSLLGCWPALPGGIGYPLGSSARFQSSLHLILLAQALPVAPRNSHQSQIIQPLVGGVMASDLGAPAVQEIGRRRRWGRGGGRRGLRPIPRVVSGDGLTGSGVSRRERTIGSAVYSSSSNSVSRIGSSQLRHVPASPRARLKSPHSWQRRSPEAVRYGPPAGFINGW